MILGIGSDLLEIERMAQAGKRYGERFHRRVFTPGERAYCESKGRPDEHLAVRFAAKEAALKALGVGWARGITWKDVEVLREEGGPPTLRFTGVARDVADALGVRRAHLSLSHSRDLALASVILDGTHGIAGHQSDRPKPLARVLDGNHVAEAYFLGLVTAENKIRHLLD